MIKAVLLIAFVVAGAAAQYAPSSPSAESNAAPEPYSYGYETDSHSAAEQRDPSGKVTGFYTVVDADGRQRRVEYVADEAGFRAKVQTNEVGTKSENSADVEVLASPPTREQLVYTAPSVQQQSAVVVQQAPQRVVSSQQVVAAGAPSVSGARYQYVQQPASAGYGYGYYPGASGYQYGSSYLSQPSYAYGSSSYSPAGYGVYGNGVYGGYGANTVYSSGYGQGLYGTGAYGNYNNHLPAQYYRSIGATSSGVGTQVVQGANTVGGRYVSAVPVNRNYQGEYVYRYPTVGVQQPAQSSSSVRSASLQGSSNYIVLKKRESESAAAAAATEEKKKA